MHPGYLRASESLQDQAVTARKSAIINLFSELLYHATRCHRTNSFAVRCEDPTELYNLQTESVREEDGHRDATIFEIKVNINKNIYLVVIGCVNEFDKAARRLDTGDSGIVEAEGYAPLHP